MRCTLLFIFCLYSFYSVAFSEQELLNTINTDSLKSYLEAIAGNEMQGRETGTAGQKRAAEYISKKFLQVGLEPVITNFLQPYTYYESMIGHNVVGLLWASEQTEKTKTIIISAHYDHLGMMDTIVYNGADDNASGTAAVIEIARVFSAAKKQGTYFINNILFIAFSGEEKGLLGSSYYVNNPVIPLKKTLANLNIDMIGRIDKVHENDSNYVYVIGSEKIKKHLKKINIAQNKLHAKLNLDFSLDKSDVNRYYYRSDHYNFAKNKIPIAFYFNGAHEDYHKSTDDAAKINYKLHTQRTKHIAAVAYKLAQLKKW